MMKQWWVGILCVGWLLAAPVFADDADDRARQRAEERIMQQIAAFEAWREKADAQIDSLLQFAQYYRRILSLHGPNNASVEAAGASYVIESDSSQRVQDEGQRIRKRITRACERMGERWPLPFECEEEELRELGAVWSDVFERIAKADGCAFRGERC